MAARLTDTERIERRKERARFSFSDKAYKHYDVDKNGFGGPDDWERIAEELFGHVEKPVGNHEKFVDRLAILGLPIRGPFTREDLTRAFRAAMFKAHPDHGGTDAKAREVLEAYASLKKECQ